MKGTRKYWDKKEGQEGILEKVRDHLHEVKDMYGMLQKQNDLEELHNSDEEDKEENKDKEVKMEMGDKEESEEKIGPLPAMKKPGKGYGKVGAKRAKKSKWNDSMVSGMNNMIKHSTKRRRK